MQHLIGGIVFARAAIAAASVWAHSRRARAFRARRRSADKIATGGAAGRRSAVRLRGMASLAGSGALLVLGGCEETGVGTRFTAIGDPERGAVYIEQIGCGSCHMIPGIDGAQGLVGPPLDYMGKRIFIAGLLRNTPANMMTWLRNPQEVVPGNAMPDMDLSEEQARDITAYLYTLD